MSRFRFPRRILVVDDTESDREAIRRFFASEPGTHLSFARTIDEALALVRQQLFDLALVDWALPDGPGAAFGSRLAAAGIAMPFILMTGHERPDPLDDALALGAVDFLVKTDLSPRVVARVCEQALARSRLARELDDAQHAERTASTLEREARAAAERALAHQANLTDRVSRLYLMTSLFSAALTTEEVARVIIAQAAVFGRPTGASFYVVKDDELVLLESQGFENAADWSRLPLGTRMPLTEAVHRGTIVRVTSADELEQKYGLTPAKPDTSQEWVCAPVGTDGDIQGVIGLRYERRDRPLNEEIDFVRLVAELASQAIVRARLYEEASRRAEFERRLLAIVGHDLRTSLSVVTMAADLLSARLPGDAITQRLRRSALRMSELIDDVMKRSEAFHLDGETGAAEPIDVVALVKEAVQEVSAAFLGRDIVVFGEGPLLASLNPTRVTQIVTNLVRNALQHGLESRPVTLTLRPSAAARMVLTVHNEGSTIPAAEIPTLFDPFRRGQRARGHGAGLGLFIVYELATAMGGRVDVDSGPGGTRFTVELPCLPHDGPVDPRP